MAANIDSPKRRSLRLQDARVAAENGPASTSSGSRGLAEPRTSAKANTLSAEKRRVNTEGQKGSSGKRRSAELLRRKEDPMNGALQEENETNQGPSDTAPSTGSKAKGDSSRSAHPMEPNTARSAHTETNAAKRENILQSRSAPSMQPIAESGHTTHSPGGDHSKPIRPKRNCGNYSVIEVESPRGAASSATTNTSFSRETRSSKAKDPGSSTAGDGAISIKEKKDKEHLTEPISEKEQGPEGPGGSSSHARSLRPKRSQEGSGTVGENSSVTNTFLKRETRYSSGKNHEGSGSSASIRGKGAISSKEKREFADVPEPISQKGVSSEDPGGSRSHDRSLRSRRSHEGSSLNVENSPKEATSSTVTNTLSVKKTRASRAKDLGEPGVTAVGDGGALVSSNQKNENPNLAETNIQQGEGSEDPGGSSSDNKSIKPRGNLSSMDVNVEDSPRGTTLSTVTNASYSRETRSSRPKDHKEPRNSTAVQGLGEGAVSGKEEKKNVHLTEPSSQEEQGPGWSNSHDSSFRRLGSHEVSSNNVKHCSRGPSSPTKSQHPITEEASRQEDSDALSGKGESVIRPSNQSGESLEVSGGVRSPGKNLRVRRSHDGSGTSGGTNEASDGTLSKEKKTEPVIQSGKVSGDLGEQVSPRKNLTTNLEDPADRTQPSNIATESNAGEATRDYKVHCRSKQLLQEVLGMCTGICKEILDSQQYLNEEQKQQHHKNFVWDFETAFRENVSINGLSWHEAPDQDSEPDIKILEDQLDEAMVETSMKRKRYPRKILSHFVTTLKTEREMLNQYKPVVNPVKVSLDPALELRMKDLSATAATISQHIHETKKALPIQLEKAEGFSQVLSLQPVLEASRIRNDIFYSRVVIEDISKSIPKVLETTPTESEPQDLATPVRSLRKRKVSLPQRHLYPLQSKRKISLDS